MFVFEIEGIDRGEGVGAKLHACIHSIPCSVRQFQRSKCMHVYATKLRVTM